MTTLSDQDMERDTEGSYGYSEYVLRRLKQKLNKEKRVIPYFAFKLDAASRSRILAAYPPKYPIVKADHITLQYPLEIGLDHEKVRSIVGKTPPTATVYGYGLHALRGVEALFVLFRGEYKRRDNSLFHITLSHRSDATAQEARLINPDIYPSFVPFDVTGTLSVLYSSPL